MQPPLCHVCGRRQWAHVCKGPEPEPQQASEPAAVTPVNKRSPPASTVAGYAITPRSRAEYMRKYMADRRAAGKA
jgi:hypothetical protein